MAGAGAGAEAREEIPKEISAKVALLMKMFDEDKDNFLNQKEMSALSNKTSASAEEGTMGDDEWQCSARCWVPTTKSAFAGQTLFWCTQSLPTVWVPISRGISRSAFQTQRSRSDSALCMMP